MENESAPRPGRRRKVSVVATLAVAGAAAAAAMVGAANNANADDFKYLTYTTSQECIDVGNTYVGQEVGSYKDPQKITGFECRNESGTDWTLYLQS